MTAYYNEHDEFAADWLRNLIKAGLIADGEVDTRSIVDVRPRDLVAFKQCHFFAGIGGWSYALRSAGWADSRPAWTGSCPCQPFSLAGARRGFADERHLWPVWRELIRECGPAIVFGEQVASATDWLGLVRGDLEEMGYAVGALPIQAASAGADHLRDRYWFVADADSEGLSERVRDGRVQRKTMVAPQGQATERDGVAYADQLGASEERKQRSRQQCGAGCDPGPCVGSYMADSAGERWHGSESATGTAGRLSSEASGLADAGCGRRAGPSQGQGEQPGRTEVERSGDLDWIIGADGKARRVKSGIRLLAHGVPNRVGLLRGFGNAIDHRPAAAFIKAYMTPC